MGADIVDLEAKRAGMTGGTPVTSPAVAEGNTVEGAFASDSGPPPPLESANAQPEGKGGASENEAKSPPEKPKTPRKVVDWGKFNYLIENFALIYGTDTVWDGGARLIMKISAMAHAHSSDMVKMWKASEKRRTVMLQDVVFDPTETCEEHCINMFGGFVMEPAEGDVKPILELIRYLTSRSSDAGEPGHRADENDKVMHYLLCWLAYPLQNKGAKLRTSVIVHGDEGAGKNFLFDVVVAIYGEYGMVVGQDELEDKFNDWRSRKLFVVGDEVSSRAELVHNKNRLKALITSTTVVINPKNLPRREEANHINVVFLSNELQPLALDNSDRRYLVLYTPRAREFEFYRDLGVWKKSGGVAAFYHYLLHYPLEDFDPYAPAPSTAAKADLINLNRKSAERFWLEWANNELELPYRTCSIDQAYVAYLKYAQRTGDRFPVQKPNFSAMVIRMAEHAGRPAKVKPCKLDSVANKTARMFLVCDPPEGTALGAWAAECIEEFEPELKRYLGRSGPHSPDEGDSRS
jgi:putative DNA primase/helicase